MADNSKYNPKIHNRKSIRLKEYDYSSQGLYFITICCNEMAHIFGKIENNEMKLNNAGEIAYTEWYKTTEIRNNVELDVFVIMPNHVHGVIQLCTDSRRGELHSPNNKEGECNSPLRGPSNNIGAIIRGYKSSVTKQLKLLWFTQKIWQRNYYEHIIRNQESYQSISSYIINNPTKWQDDKFNT